MTGTLYLCATPIGNLEDMTFRAVRILQEVDVVAAEDTRHTRKLLTHFDIHTPLVSYHEHNKLGRGPELIERLLAGESIACVSDAGMPGISDPGSHLAMLAIEAGITVTPVPGANAGLSALIASGLDTTEFHFIGFLSKQKKNRLETLARIKPIQGTLIFYESPHRLKDTLGELLDVLGDRNIVAARELTKKFEEFRRGTITELIAYYKEEAPRGEFTLIVNGAGEEEARVEEETIDMTVEEELILLIENGTEKKEAIRQVARRRNMPKREVYQIALSLA
ncbi:MAG: 16S rRNA (cytidine(1402)-2'-O)-methyltransferase [Selenomonadales bacterium]|nr:16S rRNA (cytidine(1402)-2'-O)-methyltransferase [Selenomonadales bacterium]MBQ5637391.1 16S rRNA (cytidine(1402)-2'-O)-methyltransferase [Selenomonadales bacterium]MBQ5745404.1 16S rRNA (cytidine(1402)-2'-O)-methyltransferase [Selenomonadales bacterium]